MTEERIIKEVDERLEAYLEELIFDLKEGYEDTRTTRVIESVKQIRTTLREQAYGDYS